MTEPNEELKEVNKDVYKCPGCGSNLVYNPEIQGLSCGYCGYELKLNGENSCEEHDLDSAELKTWNRDAKEAKCPNCGANVVIPPDMLSAKCPFCDTAMVISTEDIQGFKPDRVIPFKIGETQAAESYCKWIKKRALAARRVKKEIPNPSMHSVYIPSWTFDTNAFASYKGRLGKEYTTTVGSGKNARTVTKIRWFNIEGVVQRDVDDILICSGKQLEQTELQKIEPFDTNGSYVYDNRYLSGHTTEHYDLSLSSGWKKAQDMIYERLKSQILDKYDYDKIDYLKIYPTYSNTKYKYVILPVWICHFLFNKKKFRFIVNGENGKVTGKFPISPVKVGIIVFVALALIVLFTIWALAE